MALHNSSENSLPLEEANPKEIPTNTMGNFKKRMWSIYPIVLSIVGVTFFAVMFLLVKLLSGRINAFEISFFRSIFQGSLAISILFCSERKTPFDFEKKYLWILFTRSSINFLSAHCLIYALRTLYLSEALVISFTNPVFVGIFAAIFLKEAWGKMDALGAILCMAGVVLISKPPFLFSPTDRDTNIQYWIAIGAVLLHAITAGWVTCWIRATGKIISPLQNIAWLSMVTTLFSVVGMVATQDFQVPDILELIMLAFVGITSFVGQWCFNRALQLLNAVNVATIGYLQVVLSIVMDIVFYGFYPDRLSICGMVFICSWAIISLVKQWFGDSDVPLFTMIRLKLTGKSTTHQLLPSTQGEEEEEEQEVTTLKIAVSYPVLNPAPKPTD